MELRRTTAAITTEEPTVAPRAISLAFLYYGAIEICEVPLDIQVARIRNVIKEMLELPCKVIDIRLYSLVQDDGTWPQEADAMEATGRSVAYLGAVQDEFRGGEKQGVVHFRVEVHQGDKNTEHPKDVDVQMISTASTKDEEDAEDVEDSDGSDDSEMEPESNARTVEGPLAAFYEIIRSSELYPLPSCNKNTSTSIFMYNHIETYIEVPNVLPEAYMATIEGEYRKNVMSWHLPWDLMEKEKSEFISSVLSNCVACINEKIWIECGHDMQEYNLRRLKLHREIELKEKNMVGVGKADYIIERGDRMVVVIEAKHCDMTQAKHQNFAVMNAARLNEKINNNYRTIKGICTDFQSWVFVSRNRRSIYTDSTSLVITNGFELPANLRNVVYKVYGMLEGL